MNNDHETFFDHATAIMSKISYGLSGGLVVGDVINYLDNHAAAMGVILGFLTYGTQFFFNCMRHRAYVKALENGIKPE